MKTLYITNLGLLDNLARTQILPYLEGLSQKGIEVHVLSFEKKENLKFQDELNSLKRRLKGSGIRWNRMLYHNRWGNMLDVFAGMVKTWGLVKKEKISVLHARSSIPILIAWPLAKILGCKLIYDRRGTMVGDFIDDVNVKNIFSVSIFSAVLGALERFIMRHSDATIVLSERALDDLKKNPYINRPGSVFEAIPCCADSERFKEGARGKDISSMGLSGKFVMSYVGSLGTCYLLREMAQFYKFLKKKKKNAFFLIISHTDKSYIEGVLKKEGLLPGSDYTIIGVKPEEVPLYLGASDCSIMFIKPVECKVGSSPTKFGESLIAGVPVIINKGIGDTEEIVRSERVGALVDDFNEDSYEKAAKELFSLSEEKESLKNRCVNTAKAFFSLSMGIDKYKNVYERLNKL